MNAAYIMADNKMDIDPSGDTHRTGSSAFAPDPFLPGQIPSKCRKKANGGNQGNSFGSTSIVGVEKKQIISSSVGRIPGTAFMRGKTGCVF